VLIVLAVIFFSALARFGRKSTRQLDPGLKTISASGANQTLHSATRRDVARTLPDSAWKGTTEARVFGCVLHD
jgi:hypothetical protein